MRKQAINNRNSRNSKGQGIKTNSVFKSQNMTNQNLLEKSNATQINLDQSDILGIGSKQPSEVKKESKIEPIDDAELDEILDFKNKRPNTATDQAKSKFFLLFLSTIIGP